MFNSTVSDIGPWFFIMCKKHSKDQTCGVLGLLYIGFHAQYFLKQGRRAVKAGHYAACQEAKEEIKVTSQSIFHQKPACTNLISINTEHLLVCCTIFS